MSTDLYGVRVLDVAPDERRLRLRVFVVYYDTSYESHQPIPSDRSFFVRVLCDKDALGNDIARDDRFNEDYIDQNAFRFVDGFEELERRNAPVESYDDYSDFYYEQDGRWQDEDLLVQADYDVFVTKAEYLEPFAVGDSWGTTSYETSADALTAEEYLDIPDFGDVENFTPFPDAEDAVSTVSTMSFSADGRHLLVSNDAGGFRVFSTDDWSMLLDVPEAGSWLFQPGWTHDGRIAGAVDNGFVAYEMESGESEAFEPYGWAANAGGTRFLNGPTEDTARIFDERGEVLFEMERPREHMARAGFDSSGDVCALAIESQDLRLVHLQTGEVDELGHTGLNSIALSPDGQFILASTFQEVMVLRAETGEAIRSMQTRGRYVTAVAWSPDGSIAATSLTDAQGFHSKVMLHRIGRDVLRAENAPVEVPTREERDITDVVELYLEQTDDFSPGWSSHLDDDLLDFHLALARMGEDVDLVPHINAEPAQIASRAYEAVIAHQSGDVDRARDALADAVDRLERFEVPEWSHTFVFAPVAAAQFVLGQTEAADASLELALVALDQEANVFQKRAIMARAYLVMGRVDEVRELIQAESAGWLSDFHMRLLSDLIDAGEFALLEQAFAHWGVANDWSKPQAVQKRLLDSGAFERATSLDWLDCDRYDHHTSVTAWRRWFEEDPDAAQQRFDERLEEAPDDDVLLQVAREPNRAEASPTDEPPENREPAERVEWLGRQGRWEEVYEEINATKKTLRNPLYERVVDTACARGDLDILLDALGRLPCTDMNAPGLRALQRAIRELARPHFREFHP